MTPAVTPIRPRRVYIAAPFPMRKEAILLMQRLEARGVHVTSGWLRQDDPLGAIDATKDLDDIIGADMMIVMIPPGFENQGTGGRHVEFGYALGMDIPVIVLGGRTNMFHYLNHIIVLPYEATTLPDILRALGVPC